jgi:hypothetical protein
MKEYQLAVLTALLQKLDVEYMVSENTLTIKPRAASQMSIFPGEGIELYSNSILVLNLKEFDLIQWIASIVNRLEQAI